MQQTPDPTPLSVAVAEVIARRGLGRSSADRQLASTWKKVAGERIAGLTRVRSIKRGVLQVDVANGAMLNELVSFHQHALLRTLQSDYAALKIKELKFRLKGDLEQGG